jgi:hypothetical protein
MVEQQTKQQTSQTSQTQEQEKKSKVSEVLNKFGQFGASAWKEVKEVFLSLDPQTQRYLLTAMFKINPEQARLFAGEAGITLPPGTGGQMPTPTDQKQDNMLIFIIAGIAVFVLIVILLIFMMKKK